MSEEIFKTGLKTAASLIAIAGKTAPKAKGIDTLKIKVLTSGQKTKLVRKMKEIANSGYHTKTFLRDLKNVAASDAVILVGSINLAHGLDCKFCGHLCKDKSVCAYTGVDLGIAIGSMVSTASALKIDNRIMYTAGYAALKGGFFSKKIKIALGIPLSVSSKNIFFDRK